MIHELGREFEPDVNRCGLRLMVLYFCPSVFFSQGTPAVSCGYQLIYLSLTLYGN